jgi:hypothetical protein
MSSCDQCCIKKAVNEKGIAPYVNLVFRSLILEKPIHYAFLWLLFLGNFYFVRNTNLTNLSYISLAIIEFMWLHIIITKFEMLPSEPEKEQEALDFFLYPFQKCKECIGIVKIPPAVENFKKNSLYKPVLTTLICLGVVIVAQIFKGPVMVFLTCFSLLVVPPYIKFGIHKIVSQLFMKHAWPPLKPHFDAHVKPILAKVFNCPACCEANRPATPVESAVAETKEEEKKEEEQKEEEKKVEEEKKEEEEKKDETTEEGKEKAE